MAEIIFYFSERDQVFYNMYPTETRTFDDSYAVLGILESDKASEFVWFMNRHRFKGNFLTLDFVIEKFESYLSNYPVDSSKIVLKPNTRNIHLHHGKESPENESRSEGIIPSGDQAENP